MCFFFCRVNDKDKNDVYDIGAILLEIILGRQITSQNEVHVSRDLVSKFSVTKKYDFFIVTPSN